MQVEKKQIDNFSPGREIPCIQMKAETEQHKSTNVCYPLYLNKSVNPDLYLSVDVNIAKGKSNCDKVSSAWCPYV